MPKRSRETATAFAPVAKRSRIYSSDQMRPPRRRRNLRTAGYLGIEKKFVDYEYGPTAITATVASSEADPTTALALNSIAQGDGENQRDGRRANVHSVFVHGIVKMLESSGAAFTAPAVVKIAMVLDKQTNAAQLNAEDVFVDPTSTSHDAVTFRNLQFSKRFQILSTKQLTFNPSWNRDADDYGAANLPFDMSYNFKKGLPVEFVGTTAAIASIQNASIHVIAIASPVLAVAGFTLLYSSRVRFTG